MYPLLRTTCYLSLRFLFLGFAWGNPSVTQSLQADSPVAAEWIAFGESGGFKMIYDRRQGPAGLLQGDQLFITYQGATFQDTKKRLWARPLITAIDLDTWTPVPPVVLGPASSNHHHGPVLWLDNDGFLNILAGCHKSPGLHLQARRKETIGTSQADWTYGRGIASSLSYPTFVPLPGDRTLVYYRTYGHPSSWTYRITQNNGISWEGPPADVVDLDLSDALDWSSYHSVQLDPNGKILHIAFVGYDDNKAKDAARFYNPRYKITSPTGGEKFNLYYIALNVETGEVRNHAGTILDTPIDLAAAEKFCKLLDTDYRYAQLPPRIAFDDASNPVFLHTLSGDTYESFTDTFISFKDGKWHTVSIAENGNGWNNSHLEKRSDGNWYVLRIVSAPGDGDSFMEKHGGGRLEEWVSKDKGLHWSFSRHLHPGKELYSDWIFNNIQPVTNDKGHVVENLYILYGWPSAKSGQAKGFVLKLPETDR